MAEHWLNEMEEEYGDRRSRGWEYGWGKDGQVSEISGRRQIDCSHLLNRGLKKQGFNIPYERTSALRNSDYFDPVTRDNLKKGDIVLYDEHAGFYYGKDYETGRDLIYSSAGSRDRGGRGPSIDPADGFKGFIKYMRPKEKYLSKEKREASDAEELKFLWQILPGGMH